MSLIIGLTGGIGCGKSTVSSFFSAQGVEVVDADKVARLVVQKGQPALALISDYFGADIIDNGHLNRAKLRAIIFSDDDKKAWLNNLLHPLIREQMLFQLQKAKGKYVLLEAPLLFENNLQQYCDFVIVVDIDEQRQVKRTVKRDKSSVEETKAIINSQISRQQRLSQADFVIDNADVTLLQLESAVIALDKQLLALQ